MEAPKNKLHYLNVAIGFATAISVVGAFLTIPSSNHLGGLGFFLWFMFLIIADLATIFYIFKKVKLSVFNILLLLSYLFLTLGFIVNTKEHAGNFLLLIILLPIINISLTTNVLSKNFIFRYIYSGLYFLYAKVGGVFAFIAEFIRAKREIKEPQADNKQLQKVKSVGKILVVFLITGLPLIILVVSMLKSTNTEYAKWIDEYLSFSFDRKLVFGRVLFILFAFPYFLTELFLIREVINHEKLIISKDIKTSKAFKNTAVLVALLTTTILNIFYILFVIAELKYDISNPRDLIDVKNYDTYSQIAVERFWELIYISIINLGITYLCVKPFRFTNTFKTLRSNIFLANALFLFINTVFLIYSAHKRLSLYESGYGFTNKRFLAHTFLPVLLIIGIILFASFVTKKYTKQLQVALGILILYFATYIMLPTDYIIPKLNYIYNKTDKVVVYDATYTVQNNSKSELMNGYTYDRDLQFNDITSTDGYFVAVDILNDKSFELRPSERRLLQSRVRAFLHNYEGKDWRQVTLSEVLLKNKIQNAGLDL